MITSGVRGVRLQVSGIRFKNMNILDEIKSKGVLLSDGALGQCFSQKD